MSIPTEFGARQSASTGAATRDWDRAVAVNTASVRRDYVHVNDRERDIDRPRPGMQRGLLETDKSHSIERWESGVNHAMRITILPRWAHFPRIPSPGLQRSRRRGR